MVEITVLLPLQFDFMGEVKPINLRKMYKYSYFKDNSKDIMEYLNSEITRVIDKYGK